MDIKVYQGDITIIHVDAIVNAANSSLLGGSGVDGAIHRAGGKTLLEDCQKIRNKQGSCKAGQAVITTAGNLPAKFVIHAVGPVWMGGIRNEQELLYKTYTNSLLLAEQNQVRTVSFPNISTGRYGFPKPIASKIAFNALTDFSMRSKNIKQVLFICFDTENYNIYKRLFKA